MELTEEERTTLNNASKDVRMAKKKIDIVLDSNKPRRQETADSDECHEAQKS